MIAYVDKDSLLDGYFLVIDNSGINHRGVQVTLAELYTLITQTHVTWYADGNVMRAFMDDELTRAYNKIIHSREV